MTAGTGVYHSEHNMSADSPLRFIQMWIEPRRLGLPPNYGSYESSREERANRWAHLVGSVGDNGAQGVPVAVHQDVNLYVHLLLSPHVLIFSLRSEKTRRLSIDATK